ncbi:hypothetical protein SAMN04488511_101377 [Pedobacter suwonensis]|uniref:Uncharacterized protein n=1 Tax=Pedobacter suwonensis TaxID=332999 RepID=A0A1I0SI93_9SPHI|nr:DUF6364 family protein [Pedobacter suwonensis]SFA39147.1 hypothetical protein SAMN04488511_101377 [Pedobacter suwonensis]
MDAKLTLSFNQDVVAKAKKYAADNNISLSRLVEHLLTQVTAKKYKSLEDFPVADWVSMVAEGEVTYKKTSKKTAKQSKEEFFNAQK